MKYVVKQPLPFFGKCDGLVFTGRAIESKNGEPIKYRASYDDDNKHINVTMSAKEFFEHFTPALNQQKVTGRVFSDWKHIAFRDYFPAMWHEYYDFWYRTDGKTVEVRGKLNGYEVSASATTHDGDKFNLEVGLELCRRRVLVDYANQYLKTYVDSLK